VRLIIAASAAATVLYTPLLKRHTLVKNLAVASTIAAAPLAGALAAGAAGPGLRTVLGPSAFLFLGIMQREIMMDIQDRGGDGAAGVQTLPVVLGPRVALAVCCALLAACGALAAHAALCGGGLAAAWVARPALEPLLRGAALAAVAANLARPVAATLAVLRSGFGREEVSHAIGVGMSSAGLGTLLLAILA
jgi:4-hydroxybenzoate polyprenyltransferase